MTNHWDNELDIIALARKAVMIEMQGNFNPETITTVSEAIGIIEQVLDRYEESLEENSLDEDHPDHCLGDCCVTEANMAERIHASENR